MSKKYLSEIDRKLGEASGIREGADQARDRVGLAFAEHRAHLRRGGDIDPKIERDVDGVRKAYDHPTDEVLRESARRIVRKGREGDNLDGVVRAASQMRSVANQVPVGRFTQREVRKELDQVERIIDGTDANGSLAR
ncbi:MAG: hypothetical protein K2Q12_03920 [Rickettsiales bacterium]|nr:hypothetical protein [Rickettsiales bacterium]